MKSHQQLLDSFWLALSSAQTPNNHHSSSNESTSALDSTVRLSDPIILSHSPSHSKSGCMDEPSTDSSSSISTLDEPFYGDVQLDVELFVKGKLLIEHSHITIPVGGRCGLVGRNGTGKTSLLRAIRRRKFGVTAGLKIETVKQDYNSDELVLDYVGREGGKALHGLGFKPSMYNTKLSDLSGGWRMRAQLARAIHADPDLLLLDEPTNFLDIEAIAYLERQLKEMRRVVIVSHDRRFLDRTVNQIFRLENNKIKIFNGNYTSFKEQQKLQREREEKEYEIQQADRAHLQQFINKFRYSAKRGAQAQYKIKLLEKMEEIKQPSTRPLSKFKFKSRVGRGTLVELRDAHAKYGNKTIIEGINIKIEERSRIVIVGRNGEGKSTLLKMIAGLIGASDGRVEIQNGAVIGYLAQHHGDAFDSKAKAVELVGAELDEESASSIEEQSRSALAEFGLNVGDQTVGSLSGGQKSRLGFVLMSLKRPNVLVLDEPTNHLDLEMIDALAEALNEFEGAVVCVSHDVAFIERVFDEVYVCADGRLERFRGGVEEYKESIVGHNK